MKKLISVVVAVVVMTVMMAAFGIQASAAGDSIDKATTISLNKQYTGQKITEASPKDVFKFKLSTSGRITIDVSAYFYRSEYFLYDANGNELWSSGSCYWNGNTEVMQAEWSFDLTKGTYYLTVKSPWDYDTGSYKFKVSFKSAGETFAEPQGGNNNSIKVADTVSFDKTYKGQIAINDRDDLYKFSLKKSGKLTLKATAYIYRSGYYIHDANGNEVWNSDYNYWNDNTGVMQGTWALDLTKGTYYLTVKSPWDYDTGNYSFKLTYKDAGETIQEPQGGDNNSMQTADKLSLNKTYKGQLALNDDKDLYKFALKAKTTVTLKYTSYIENSEWYVYDSNGDTVWSDTYNYWDSNTKKITDTIKIDLKKGTYYLAVSKYWGGYTGNYTFSVTCGHSWKNSSVSKATLSSNGKITQKCSICADARKVTLKKPSSFKLSASTFTYNGKAKAPTVTVRDSAGKALKKGTDFTVSYSGSRVSPGEYKVAVKMKGNYSGTKTLKFKIVPGKTSKVTPVVKGSTLNVKWSAVKGASGYKVVLKNVKSGSTIKTITTTSAKASFASLKQGTKYKVVVTAYKTFNGKKYYSTVNNSTTAALAPAAPKVSGSSEWDIVELSWKKVTGASGYEVYRASSSGGTYTKLDMVTDASFEDYDGTEGKTYYYKVRAYTTVGSKKLYSGYSNVVKVKVVW